LECFQKQSFSLFYRNFSSAVFRNKPPRIFIKLHIRLNRKDGLGDPIVFVRSFQMPELSNSINSGFNGGKYLIKKKFVNSNPSGLGWNNYAVGFKGIPFFATNINAKDTIHFISGDTIDNDVYARKQIQIDSGVVILPNIRIMAGTEVVLNSGTEVPSGVEIFTTPTPNLCVDLGNIDNYHMDDGEITTICGSQIYRDNAASRVAPIDSFPVNENQNLLDVLLWPNPNKGNFEIIFNENIDENVIILVSDMLGRTVYNSLHNVVGNHLNIELKPITSGIYMVNIVAKNKQRKIKIIITD
jgi:hypothetical protein